VGLGALATVAVAGTTIIVSRQRRTWIDSDDHVIGERLRARLADLRS
jgi:hypothetical protein